MNRRRLLSLIGATALTPIIPPQVFAAGGIWNPEHCGLVGEAASESIFIGIADRPSWVGMSADQILRDIDAAFMVSRTR